MDLFWAIVLFIAGLVCLIKGGDWFVDGATGLAHKAHLPEILIGATVVSIGTTLPEVMVSATGALSGSPATAYGNAVGSVICNTALIAAVTVAIRPAKVDRKTFSIPVAFFFSAAALFLLFSYVFGFFHRWMGIALLSLFVIYMTFTVWQAFRHKENAPPEKDEEENAGQNSPLWKSVLFLILGAAIIALGAHLLVKHGTFIAEYFHVPQTVISLTFVALGTSLPELVTAIAALVKGHSALSLGNIIGANLFNLVLVSGLATTLAPFPLPAEKRIGPCNASLAVDLPLMVLVMAILCVPALLRNKLSRWQGVLLLVLYTAFLTFQFVF